eukprot:Awhi_evm1s14215
MSQDDFMGGKSRIEIFLGKHNHLSIFLPKFRCKINPIEKLWGLAFQRVIAEQITIAISK